MRSSFYAAQVGGGGIGGSTSLGGCVGSLSTLAQSESRTITKGYGGSYKLYGGRFFDQIDSDKPKVLFVEATVGISIGVLSDINEVVNGGG